MKIIKLDRSQLRRDGIFGGLTEDGAHLAYTLEHAYPAPGTYTAKLPPGTYTCVRGEHRLHGMTEPFVTFEIQDVPGHTGVLFHWGNFNKDSEGCVLLGTGLGVAPDGSQMVRNSRAAFEQFMHALEGQDSFTLVVDGVGAPAAIDIPAPVAHAEDSTKETPMNESIVSGGIGANGEFGDYSVALVNGKLQVQTTLSLKGLLDKAASSLGGGFAEGVASFIEKAVGLA